MKYSKADFGIREKISAELGAVRSVRIDGARLELVEFRKAAIFLNGGGTALCFPILHYLEFMGAAWLVLIGGMSFLAGLFVAMLNIWSSARRYTALSSGILRIGKRLYEDQLEIEDVSAELERVSRDSGPRIRDWQWWAPMAFAFLGAGGLIIVLVHTYLSNVCF